MKAEDTQLVSVVFKSFLSGRFPELAPHGDLILETALSELASGKAPTRSTRASLGLVGSDATVEFLVLVLIPFLVSVASNLFTERLLDRLRGDPEKLPDVVHEVFRKNPNLANIRAADRDVLEGEVVRALMPLLRTPK